MKNIENTILTAPISELLVEIPYMNSSPIETHTMYALNIIPLKAYSPNKRGQYSAKVDFHTRDRTNTTIPMRIGRKIRIMVRL